VKTYGLDQEFLDHGTREQILEAAGLTPQHLARQLTEAVARRTPAAQPSPAQEESAGDSLSADNPVPADTPVTEDLSTAAGRAE